jgi:hypothetical protein
MPPSTEGFGQGPELSPSFTNPQSRPRRVDWVHCSFGHNTHHHRRILLTLESRLLSATSDDPDRAFQVFFSIDHSRRASALTVDAVGLYQGPGLVSMLYPHSNVLNSSANREIIVRLHPYALLEYEILRRLSLIFTVY